MSRFQEIGMPDQGKLVARPWRRFLHFSVRGLIVLVLVSCVGMGWLVRSARIQREAVAALAKAGGFPSYNWEWANGKSIPGGEPWAPRWLVNLIGVDYFGHVDWVTFFNSSTVTDATIEQVGRLTGLEELVVLRSSHGDAGLAHLKGLTNLKRLVLGTIHVTDSDLVHLKGLRNLTSLTLGDNQLSDAWLAHLKELTNLSELDLYYAQVSDAGIEELKRALPNLKVRRH
jgi:hypothetical protein